MRTRSLPNVTDVGESLRPSLRIRKIPALVTIIATTVITSSVAYGAPRDRVLVVADYAFVTATHSKPSHAVTATDLLNADETKAPATSDVSLVANIGDIFSYPRLAVFSNSTTFTQSCVNFPNRVGRRPNEIKCPLRALALWWDQQPVLNGSREAVAFAETKGRAVSGSDVGHFLSGSNVHIVGNPSFKSGQGGLVRFAVKSKINKTLESGYICVDFPRTEAGIPRQVACR